jgi:5-(carboxyamino)imidazole ribonucleotide synthase
VAFQPLSSIGIVGGGQLALMLAEAASELGVALHVQTPGADDPAARLATSLVLARLDDAEATRQLAQACGAISFENEWVPIEALTPLVEGGVRFVPGLDALAPLMAKRSQRELLERLNLPSLRWCGLEAVLDPAPAQQRVVWPYQPQSSPLWEGGGSYTPVPPQGSTDVSRSGGPLGPSLPPGVCFPLMAKASRGGYDGKGTVPINDQAELERLLERVNPSDWILEERVAFERELAVVAARDREGRVVCFPLVETHQHGQVCDWVLFPAPVDHAAEAFARNVAASLLTALDYVGVLAIEFFYGPAGLQVNEIAPRTHNSGHLTIEACRCSQFAQQVRVVAGLPLGSTDPIVPGALMVNLLGPDPGLSPSEEASRLAALRALPGAHLHWYGKSHPAPGRKLGHLTFLLEGLTQPDRQAEKEQRLMQVRRIWPLPQAVEGQQTP